MCPLIEFIFFFLKEYSCLDEYWVMYRIFESLHCTPETNTALYVLNLTGIKIFLKCF